MKKDEKDPDSFYITELHTETSKLTQNELYIYLLRSSRFDCRRLIYHRIKFHGYKAYLLIFYVNSAPYKHSTAAEKEAGKQSADRLETE